jgi:uncharacterized protein
MTLPDEPMRERLLEVAEQSIWHGLATGHPLPVHPPDEPDPLRDPRASFVTLSRHGRLRGCIGTIEPLRPLVDDVAHNAYAAAFRDPRFLPITEAELPELELQISLLTPPQPLVFGSEPELLQQLRPGRDGLILHDGAIAARCCRRCGNPSPMRASSCASSRSRRGCRPSGGPTPSP